MARTPERIRINVFFTVTSDYEITPGQAGGLKNLYSTAKSSIARKAAQGVYAFFLPSVAINGIISGGVLAYPVEGDCYLPQFKECALRIAFKIGRYTGRNQWNDNCFVVFVGF